MPKTAKPDNVPCRVLGIDVPRLEEVRDHREASTYSLFLVALLESGEPMTLEQVARRFEEAGIAPFEKALRSLKRSRPARPPVYRQGEYYSLDPHDDDLDLWAFRLDLRPAKGQPVQEAEPPAEPAPAAPAPVPPPEVAVSPAELEEAFSGASLSTWSRQRLAILLMEAYGPPMSREQGAARLDQWTRYHGLSAKWPNRWTHGAVLEDAAGRWTFDPTHPQVPAARQALRALLAKVRAEEGRRRQEAVRWAASSARSEEREEKERQAYEALRRCLLFAFPQESPQRVVSLDLASREMNFWSAPDFAELHQALASYEWLGALEVRSLLSSLGFEAGERHLAEMGPSQKTLTVPGRRPLRITAEAMVKGCSHFKKPFGDPKQMLRLLQQGKDKLVRRRMAKAMQSLFSLYRYCRLHGAARIIRGHVEERIPVPWVHRVETTLWDLKKQAFGLELEIEGVLGPSFSLEDSWRSAVRMVPIRDGPHSLSLIFKSGGWWVDEWSILAARLVVPKIQEGDAVH